MDRSYIRFAQDSDVWRQSSMHGRAFRQSKLRLSKFAGAIVALTMVLQRFNVANGALYTWITPQLLELEGHIASRSLKALITDVAEYPDQPRHLLLIIDALRHFNGHSWRQCVLFLLIHLTFTFFQLACRFIIKKTDVFFRICDILSVKDFRDTARKQADATNTATIFHPIPRKSITCLS